jgi:hypothetical protein
MLDQPFSRYDPVHETLYTTLLAAVLIKTRNEAISILHILHIRSILKVVV